MKAFTKDKQRVTRDRETAEPLKDKNTHRSGQVSPLCWRDIYICISLSTTGQSSTGREEVTDPSTEREKGEDRDRVRQDREIKRGREMEGVKPPPP